MSRVEKKLGQRIAMLRRQAQLTQAALAESVGVANETISRLERGTAMPSLSRMDKIADALGVELSEVFQFRDRETAKDKATDRLLSIVRRKTADDIEMIADVATRVLSR